MTWMHGYASNPKEQSDPSEPPPRIWFVIDSNDQRMVKFDHSAFDFLNGTPVKYVDDDGDGFADDVQVDDAMLRYVTRAGLAPDAPAETHAALHEMIAKSLYDARLATGDDRDKALRRLRAQIDRFEDDIE